MYSTKAQIITAATAVLVCCLLGVAVYPLAYKLTIDLIHVLANGQLSFYGNYPSSFMFGLVVGTNPIAILLCYHVQRHGKANKNNGLARILGLYGGFLCLSWILCGYCYKFSLFAENDFYKPNKVFNYDVQLINLAGIGIAASLMATSSTIGAVALQRWYIGNKTAVNN